MSKKNLWLAIALMMAMGMTGCGSSDQNDDGGDPDVVVCPEYNDYHPIELTRAEQELVGGSNDFAFNLFRQTRSEAQSQIVSPISITYALGMLNNGAAGDTRKQIDNVLGFGETGADGINAFCQKMLHEAGHLDQLTKVLIANTIYMNQGYELKPAFVEAAKTYYDAEPETRDFADGRTLDVINQWASDHTERMITEVLNEDTFSPLAVSYLLNAIYFKGIWADKFSKGDTRNEAFEGASQKLPTMHLEASEGRTYVYRENDLCQALRLPYGNGAYAMTVLLPREGKTVADVAASLTDENWQQYRWGETVTADVKLPRFSSSTDINLGETMQALGMPNAFLPELAEFPDFCNAPTYIGLMKQVARIEVNETGTEAAAVTVIGMELSAAPTMPMPRRVEFHAQRPFLYVISEQSTGAIFFIGQYMGD